MMTKRKPPYRLQRLALIAAVYLLLLAAVIIARAHNSWWLYGTANFFAGAAVAYMMTSGEHDE